MPRQPFSAARNTDTALSFGPDSIDERPSHTALIGQCLALWPEIENQLAIMLGALLKADNTASVALYHTLRRSTQRLASLEAASTDRLGPKEREMFSAVLTLVRSVEAERNFYAHALYGHCDQFPKSIMCVDQTSYARFALPHLAKPRLTWKYTDDEAKDIIDNVYHATEKDLGQLKAQIMECFTICFNFNSLIVAQNHGNSGDEQYDELAQTKVVADILLRLRQAAAQKSG